MMQGTEIRGTSQLDPTLAEIISNDLTQLMVAGTRTSRTRAATIHEALAKSSVGKKNSADRKGALAYRCVTSGIRKWSEYCENTSITEFDSGVRIRKTIIEDQPSGDVKTDDQNDQNDGSVKTSKFGDFLDKSADVINTIRGVVENQGMGSISKDLNLSDPSATDADGNEIPIRASNLSGISKRFERLTKGWTDTAFKALISKTQDEAIKRGGELISTKGQTLLPDFTIAGKVIKDLVPVKPAAMQACSTWAELLVRCGVEERNVEALSTELATDYPFAQVVNFSREDPVFCGNLIAAIVSGDCDGSLTNLLDSKFEGKVSD